MPLRQEDYFYEEYERYKEKQIPKKQEKQAEKVAAVTSKKVKNKRKRNALKGIAIFGVAIAIVYRYVAISNVNMEVIKLKNELNEINTMNAQLMLAAEKSIDLKEIEKYATEELGLQKPQNYQIEYINLDKQDFINKQEIIENKNWFETVIFNVIEFFN